MNAEGETRPDAPHTPGPAPKHTQPPPAPTPKRAQRHERRRIKGPKLWLFRIAAITIVPVAFFLLIELILRVVGFGYPTSFFVPASGRGEFITNTEFGRRFFPDELARSPLTFSITKEKPGDTYRIFTLGASASLGFPDPAYNYGRVLEIMLERNFQEIDFEVINVGMTAINSHVVRAIAAECAEFEPDMFIVYLGNNEVVGPFGPGTVFEEYSPSVTAVRASLWVKSTKIGQAIESMMSGLTGSAAAHETWGGMTMFLDRLVPPNDPRLDTVYSSFRANMSDIRDAGIDAGADVVLCTVASNLKDNPPFASMHSPPLAEADLTRWREWFEQGVEAQRDGDALSAARLFRQALEKSPHHAETAYRLAQCYLADGQRAKALVAFEQARDLDALRFRADSNLNDTVRRVANDRSDSARLVDVEKAFSAPGATGAPGIAGSAYFHEHVHLNFDGNYALASLIFESIADDVASQRDGSERDGSMTMTIPSREACAEALAYTPWDRLKIAREVHAIMSRPPFTNQIDHESRAAEREAAIARLENAMGPGALEQSAAMYRAAIESRPDDLLLRDKFAHLLSKQRRFDEAVEQWRFLLDRLPEHAAARNGLGLALASLGQYAEAEREYRTALQYKPDFADAMNNLGMALYMQRDASEAIEWYRSALEEDPNHARAHYNLGIAHAARDQTDGAMRSYRKAIEANPRFAPAHNNLANALLRRNQIDEAIEHLETAVEIDPSYVSANRNLAVAYEAKGDLAGALRQWRIVMRLNPTDNAAAGRVRRLERLVPGESTPSDDGDGG